MATRAYNKTLVLDASYTFLKVTADSISSNVANIFGSNSIRDASLNKLDTSANSFTTRINSHDLIIDKLDASATSFTTRLNKLDTSSNTFTAKIGVLDSSAIKYDASFSDVYSKLSWQYILGTTQWDNYVDASFSTLQVRIDGSFSELTAYNNSTYATIANTYTKTEVNNGFANVALVSSHTTSINKLDASATSFTTSINKLDASATSFTNSIGSNYSQITALQASVGKLDVSAASFTTRLSVLDTSVNFVNGSWTAYDASLSTVGDGQVHPTFTVTPSGKYKQIGKMVMANANFSIDTDGSGEYLVYIPINATPMGYKNSTVIIEDSAHNLYTGVLGSVLNDPTHVKILVNSSPAVILTHEHASVGHDTSISINIQYQVE